jgi:catecholate siderophore receptor
MSNSPKVQPKPPAARRHLPLGALVAAMTFSSHPALAQSTAAPTTTTGTAPADTQLAPVTVQGERDRPGATGYQGGTTRIGKTEQLPKDIPQSITVVPRAVITDQGADTLRGALRNVPGLTFNAGEGGRIGDNINLRGFYSFGDLYLDGIRDVAQYNRETFFYEQVDVMRGAAAMLFGHGQAGGVINQVSKRPFLSDSGEVSVGGGADKYFRTTLDVNKVLGQDTALRLNAMKHDAGSTRDNVTSERNGIAPTISFGIGTRHEFSVGYLHLHTRNVPDYGVPYFDRRPINVPATRFYGTTSDYEENNVGMTTGTYTFRIKPGTELRSTLRFADYERDLWAVAPRLAAGTTSLSDSTVITRQRQARGGEEHTITSQTDLTSKFSAFGFKHEGLLGVELLKERAGRWNYTSIATAVAPNTTLGSPDANAALPIDYGNQIRTGINTYEGRSIGVYMQDTIELRKSWKLLAGLRRDDLNARYSNGADVKYGEWSYRGGLLYQPTDTQTYYASMSNSFNPTADLYQFTAATVVYPAERSRTYELGSKWELFDGNLSVRSALYRAVKFWERNTDFESAAAAALISKERHTDGIELEAAGRISQNWEVFGGVAFMRARIDENAPTSNPNTVGMRPRNAPPYTASLWSTYRFAPAWRAGGGVEAKGARLAYGTGGTGEVNPSVAPRYYRLDAMLAYEQRWYSVRLNVLNLLDQRYYEQVYDNGGHVIPGTSRTFFVTVNYRFL